MTLLIRFASIAVVTALAAPAWAQRLPPGVEELARELEDTKVAKAPANATPPTAPPDKKAPSARLPAQIDELERLAAISDPDVARFVRLALAHVETGWAAFHGGSRDQRLGHLDACLAAVKLAQDDLDAAIAAADPDDDPALIEVQRQLSLTAQRMSTDVVDQAEVVGVPKPLLKPARRKIAAGDQALADGRHAFAVGEYAEGMALGGDTIVFDLALFETNLRAAFDPKAVGHAYAIAQSGAITRSGHFGLARTAADPPQTDQSDTKPMHIAGATQPITAVLTLRLLADLGLGPDEPIGPWLPSDWVRGAGVAQLTFAQVMNHRTGFGQKAGQIQGEDYAPLRSRIALPVGDASPLFDNANFALLRVLSSRLQGVDPIDHPDFEPGPLTAAMFIVKLKALFASLGLAIDCRNDDPVPTIQYRFPDKGTKGYKEPSRELSCGGYGAMTSPRDYTGLTVNLRYSNLLPPALVADMRARYLGLMDPAMFSPFTNGKFGVYHGHGGDWAHKAGGLAACALMFPVSVEATVSVNSNAKTYGGVDHQCTALLQAFDNGWKPK